MTTPSVEKVSEEPWHLLSVLFSGDEGSEEGRGISIQLLSGRWGDSGGLRESGRAARGFAAGGVCILRT